ncbi:hypothetical protein WJX81_000191 [Elliptochloris bilobata]|uniref:SET domain-containing protein n=1 Tax=Elliptochloris bilobata TaxID=381761 RepID=A0AAW1R2I7_9CHLO
MLWRYGNKPTQQPALPAANRLVDERRLVAAEDVEPGCCILRVPQRLLLHEGTAYADAEFGAAFRALRSEAGPALDRRMALVLLLLVERARGAASAWAPFIRILPASYDDPTWWPEDDLALVEGTRLGAAAAHHRGALAQLAAWRDRLLHLRRELGGGELPPGDAWAWAAGADAVRWARSAVWSRAFNLRCVGGAGRSGIALVPIADMLDHDPSRHVAWHAGRCGSDDFQFISHTAVPQGGDLLSNYGFKSNEELLAGYGFALAPSNPADFFHVALRLGLAHSEGGGAVVAAESGQRLQRRELLARLRLPLSHYPTLVAPLGTTGSNGAALKPWRSWQWGLQVMQDPLAVLVAGGADEAAQLRAALAGTPAEAALQGQLAELQEACADAAPALGSMAGVGDVPPARLLAALGWATEVVGRCAVPGPGNQGVALLPLICALPQELLGSVADVRWLPDGSEARLLAAAPLPAGTRLTGALSCLGASYERLLLMHGPEAVSAAASAGNVAVPEALGGRVAHDAFEVCIAPPEGEHGDRVASVEADRGLLLAASGLGQKHFIGLDCNLERLLAAVAVRGQGGAAAPACSAAGRPGRSGRGRAG